MDRRHQDSAARLAARLGEPADPPGFRAALSAVPPIDRDAWLDLVLGTGELPADGPALPRGGVPYLPCPVDALVAVADHARIGPADVVVDVGAGVGRAAVAMHLLTGATAVGLEIQPALVAAARALAARLAGEPVTFVEGDAASTAATITGATVFFLYCPFGGARLGRVLDATEAIARVRPVHVAALDVPLPPRPWLALVARPTDGLELYRGAPA